jgi:glucose/arabinose dehydrogenase
MRRPSFALIPLLLAFLVQADLTQAEKAPIALARLKAPPGFRISIFAEEVDGARMMAFSPGGVLLVSESGEGRVVALPDPKHAGKAERTLTVLDGLNEPHGLAFYEGKLYVAENDKVRRYDWDEANLKADLSNLLSARLKAMP